MRTRSRDPTAYAHRYQTKVAHCLPTPSDTQASDTATTHHTPAYRKPTATPPAAHTPATMPMQEAKHEHSGSTSLLGGDQARCGTHDPAVRARHKAGARGWLGVQTPVTWATQVVISGTTGVTATAHARRVDDKNDHRGWKHHVTGSVVSEGGG